MASAVARAYNGGLGAVPPAGSRGRAPGQGVCGRSPPEAEHNYIFHKPIFAEFWFHFGENSKFLQILEVRPTCPLAVSFVSINDVALTSRCTYVA